jgi:Leucine-rich repeat (LRR) protein
VPKNIVHLKSLKTLWLNNNPIKKIPESLINLQSLTDLYLVNTPFATKKNTINHNIIENLESKGVNIWI